VMNVGGGVKFAHGPAGIGRRPVCNVLGSTLNACGMESP